MTSGLEQGRRLADGFLGTVTGQTGESLVDAQDDVVDIGDEDAFLCFEGSCSDAEIYLRLLALADVANDAGDEPAFGGLPPCQREFQRKLALILAQSYQFNGFADGVGF